jgi:hypothetical protein
LTIRSYAYERNQYVDAFPRVTCRPKLADRNGRVPVFKFGDDIFVLTYKWVNSSAGLAISADSNFKNKIESVDHCFRVQHIGGSVYQWDLDLERPSHAKCDGT